MKKVREARFLLRLISAALPIAFVGCVPYQTYEQLKNEHTRIKSAYDDLVVKYNRAIQDILVLRGDKTALAAALEKNRNQETLIQELRAKLDKVARGTPFTEDQVKDIPGVKIEEGDLSVSDEILFNSGEAKLKNAGAMKILDSIIDLIQKERPNGIVHISGHTDTDPIVRTEKIWRTNQRLAYERAYTVFEYFKDHGIKEDRVICHSFAYLKPVDSAQTKEAKAKNRRVVIGVSDLAKI